MYDMLRCVTRALFSVILDTSIVSVRSHPIDFVTFSSRHPSSQIIARTPSHSAPGITSGVPRRPQFGTQTASLSPGRNQSQRSRTICATMRLVWNAARYFTTSARGVVDVWSLHVQAYMCRADSNKCKEGPQAQ